MFYRIYDAEDYEDIGALPYRLDDTGHVKRYNGYPMDLGELGLSHFYIMRESHEHLDFEKEVIL